MKNRIGIDLGGTRIKAAIVCEDGELRYPVSEPLTERKEYGLILNQVSNLVWHLSQKLPVDGNVGLAVAGLMDKRRRKVLKSPNIPGLTGKSLARDLSRIVGRAVLMDNDANLMAIAEGKLGAAKGCRHFIAITLGTGVGGAVITGGRLLRGFNGGGGELGHTPISIDGPICSCGAVGCLEAYIGGDGIEKFVAQSHPALKGLGLKQLNQLALSGDAGASDVFAWVGQTLAVAAAGWINIFNPELIVIGGGVAAAGDLLLMPMREELKRRAFNDYLQDFDLRIARLGNMAGVVGAALMAG